jgi:hypothetical protein
MNVVRLRLVVLVAGLLAPQGTASQAGQVTLIRTPDRGIQPQAVMDDKGVVHLIYFRGEPGNGDIFYIRAQGDARYPEPIRVNSQPGSAIATGNIRGAHLAVGKNGRVHVAWNGSSKTQRGDWHTTPMLYARLNDQGTAFEPQKNVISAAGGLDGGGSVSADSAGNVWVTWHAPEPRTSGEENRRVWVARSTDEGKTFAPELPVSDKGLGACGCCGMRAFSDHKGTIFALYRSATNKVNRDTYLLTSKDLGKTFQNDKLEAWNIEACPMSSFAFGESRDSVLAAWETNGQVSFVRIDPASGKRSEAIAAPGTGGGRKHPAVAGNKQGQTILVWTEGMGWNRGGSVVWQVFDRDGKPTAERGRADGVPTWSLVTVVAWPDGRFRIFY